ncbi:MAG TPA: hypothetical protein VMT22_15770 [Terriglobales bacterium]|jgi:hypothetical protein|nr:hypothetical protein [Terriglobales bacterium]
MFVETYFDGTTAVLAGSGERCIPYPELVGEELAVWQSYLPFKNVLGTHWFELTAPEPVLTEIKRVNNTSLFDRIEIWSRKDPDPMAVGVSSLGEATRYYSIARWGEAEITLDQVKRELQLEALLHWAVLSAAVLVVIAALFLIAYA